MAGDLKKAGVELVIEGLSNFQSGMKQAGSALDSLRPPQTLLQRGFEGLFDSIASFGAKIWDVVSVTLGVLFRDAILGAINLIGDLIQKTIEAGNEFQTLQIRMTGFNLDQATIDTKGFSAAMSEAQQMTKEQLAWLQTLGAATPFDPTSIANIFTQARAYGFSADESKRLTENTIEFTSAMGLGNEALESVVRNLGQMKARGKITSTELRDLSRSAFLPLEDVLGRVAEKMGVTTQELQKLIVKPEGVPFEGFMDAFNEMVEQEPRYVGAAGRLSRAFVPATQNVQELVKSVGGLNIVTPILDFLGEKVAGLVDEFVEFNEQGDLIKTDKWDALVEAATRVGDAIVGVLTDLFGLMPSTEGLADGIINAVSGLATWIEEHHEEIVGFFKGIGETITNDIVPFITETLIPAFNDIRAWVDENRPTIEAFFTTIGEIVTGFFDDLTGGQKDASAETKTFGDRLLEFMQYVIDNKEEILKWIEVLWSVFIVSQVVGTILSIVIGVVISIIGFVLTLIGVFTTISTIISLLMNPAFWAVVAVIAAIILIVKAVQLQFQLFKTVIDGVTTFIGNKFGVTKEKVLNALNAVKTAITNQDWAGLGWYIVTGIANGISKFGGAIANAAKNAAISAYNAARNALGIRSPSTLFFNIGESTMEGMALGIQKAAGLAANSMVGAMSMVTSQAVPSVTNMSQVTNTSNFNLNINSSAQTEPILQDFDMLMSLAGI